MLNQTVRTIKTDAEKARDELANRLEKKLAEPGISPQKKGGLKRVYRRELAELEEKIKKYESGKKVICIQINVHWTYGGNYGAQAQCTAYITTEDGTKQYIGKKTRGWGYDKLSVAVAYALNESPDMLALLYEVHRANPKQYGIGNHSNFLYWEDGGVGYLEFEDAFMACGFDRVTSGGTDCEEWYTYAR